MKKLALVVALLVGAAACGADNSMDRNDPPGLCPSGMYWGVAYTIKSGNFDIPIFGCRF